MERSRMIELYELLEEYENSQEDKEEIETEVITIQLHIMVKLRQK